MLLHRVHRLIKIVGCSEGNVDFLGENFHRLKRKSERFGGNFNLSGEISNVQSSQEVIQNICFVKVFLTWIFVNSLLKMRIQLRFSLGCYV
jgi:hypothetical protein